MAWIVGYDPTKPVGQRLSAEVQAEIALLVPSQIPNGSVNEDKITTGAVTPDKIAPAAVTSDAVAPAAITAEHITAGGVGVEHLQPGAVTPEKVAPGIPTVEDHDGAPTSLTFKTITESQKGALGSVYQPNTVYIVRPNPPGS